VGAGWVKPFPLPLFGSRPHIRADWVGNALFSSQTDGYSQKTHNLFSCYLPAYSQPVVWSIDQLRDILWYLKK
jgi:hypothetical protein